MLGVKRRRLELPRHNCHYPLKVARLPIPPSLHTTYMTQRTHSAERLPYWCPEQDSNLHASRHTHLKRARLPIPPPGHFGNATFQHGAENETRTRDPNLGKVVLYQLSYFRVCGCKGRHFPETCKHSPYFFSSKKHLSFIVESISLIINSFCHDNLHTRNS